MYSFFEPRLSISTYRIWQYFAKQLAQLTVQKSFENIKVEDLNIKKQSTNGRNRGQEQEEDLAL
jgi:hypothetical protein